MNNEIAFSSKSKTLINNSPWHFTNLDDWNVLFNDAPIISMNKNQIVYHRGDSPRFVYFIKKGRVRSSISDEDGQEQTILIYSEGTIFGEDSAIERVPHGVTTTTNTNCFLAYMPYDDFIEGVESCPILSMQLSRSLNRKMTSLIYQIKEIALLNSEERVVAYLIKLADCFGKKTELGIKISISFTHQEMADLIATSRVSVSKVMSTLNKKGVLEKVDGYLYIKDKEALLQWHP